MRKNSKSLRKSSPKKILRKKESLKKSSLIEISSVNIQSSLYRKYSTSQNYYYLSILNEYNIKDQSNDSTQATISEEHLQKYHNSLSRKHIFSKVKQVYKMHKQIPKIQQPAIKNILNKCYHRKRLFEYFKIAKILGIQVQRVNFSTFLMSINDMTNKKVQSNKLYDPIIPKISCYQFSQEVQKQLIQQLQAGQNKQNIQKYQNKIISFKK